VADDGVDVNPDSEPATIATVASEARRLETTEVATIGPSDRPIWGRRGSLGGLIGLVGRGSSSICDGCRTAA
jgi:hypothetical protein